MLTGAIRDADLAPVQPLGNAFRLLYRRRWMAPGSWELTVPTGSPEAEAIHKNPAGGITLSDGDRVVFSGVFELTARGSAVAATRTIEPAAGASKDVTVFTGGDDFSQLADRIVEPDPTLALPAAYDARRGAASTVALGLISDHAGPTAVPERRISGLDVAPDPTLGATVSVNGRWQVLLDVLREVAVQGGVGVDVAQVGRRLLASVRETVDLSADIRLSITANNIAQAEVSASPTFATHVVAGGGGQLADRLVQRRRTDRAVRRIERFHDQRHVSDAGELAEAAEGWLAESAGAYSLAVDPAEMAGAIFGVDFLLGDLVGVDLGAGVLRLPAVGVDADVSPRKATRRFLLGAESAANERVLMRSLAAVAGRVSRLERR